MGKKFKVDPYDKKHLRNLSRLANVINEIYSSALFKASAVGALGGLDSNGWFLFDKDKRIEKRIDAILEQMQSDIQNAIEKAEADSVDISISKNEAMIDYFALKSLDDVRKGISPRSLRALESFQKRKINGMNLSKRVWNLTEQFKQELELALECGIGDGIPANEMAHELRKYLNEPNKLFRRVRDKNGELRLSKNAMAYHPTTGVYRSSARNAQRLARTETNIAYRTSDYENWKEFDFVNGIKVQVSQSNHPIHDICDDLAGVYPKDFKFTGWHPNCRCHAVPLLKTREEMRMDDDRILNGEEPLESPNKVRDLPKNYIGWIKDNAERLERAEKRGKLPYFVKDNDSMKLLK